MTLYVKQIKRVARNVSSQWPGVVEPDDLEQMIWVHILERPGTQRDLDGMDEHSRYRTLSKLGHRVASQERADLDHFSGNFRYSVDEVKSVLSRGVLVEDIDGFDEAVFDLMEALKVLVARSPQYADAITSRYADQVNPSGDAKVTLSRALTSLTDEMNKSNKRQHTGVEQPNRSLGDGPGTRTVIPISAGRYLSKEGWDADYTPAPGHMRDNTSEPEVWS